MLEYYSNIFIIYTKITYKNYKPPVFQLFRCPSNLDALP